MKKPCPLCGEQIEIKINKKNRPFLRCDSCGVLMFINKRRGMELLDKGIFYDSKIKKNDSIAAFIEN